MATYEYNTAATGTHDELIADDRGVAAHSLKSMAKDIGYLNARITGLTPNGSDSTGVVTKHDHDGAALTDGNVFWFTAVSCQPCPTAGGTFPDTEHYRMYWASFNDASGTILADDITADAIVIDNFNGIDKYDVWVCASMATGSPYIVCKNLANSSVASAQVTSTSPLWIQLTSSAYLTASTSAANQINFYADATTASTKLVVYGIVIRARGTLT